MPAISGQITLAWLMYADNNQGYLPAAAPKFGTFLNDWLVWFKPLTQQKLDQSALAPYVRRPLNPMLFRCPSDDWQAHIDLDGNTDMGPYYFSYCLNVRVSNTFPVYNTEPSAGYRPLKITKIKNQSNKIVFIEVDGRLIVDGMWDPPDTPGDRGRVEQIGSRHGGYKGSIEEFRDYSLTYAANQRMLGNASFSDGHVDYISGNFARDPGHLWPYRRN